jgi:ribosome-associated heat shock protein Hsp15
MTEVATSARQRLDKWLFFARTAKSRTLAQNWIESGLVKVNGTRAAKSGIEIRLGDCIEIRQDRRDIVLIVKGIGDRRGPYEEARLLYEDQSPPVLRQTPFEQATRETGAGRPEKKERRQIDRLQGHGSQDWD